MEDGGSDPTNCLPRSHPVMEEFVKLPQSGNTRPFLSFGGQPRKRGCMFLGLEVPEWARHRKETQLPRVSMPFLGRPIFQEGLRPAMEEGGTTFTPLHLRAYLALPWSSMKGGHSFPCLAGPRKARCGRVDRASLTRHILWRTVVKKETQSIKQGTGSPVWLCRGFSSEASCGTEGHRFLYLDSQGFPGPDEATCEDGVSASQSCLPRVWLTQWRPSMLEGLTASSAWDP